MHQQKKKEKQKNLVNLQNKKLKRKLHFILPIYTQTKSSSTIISKTE